MTTASTPSAYDVSRHDTDTVREDVLAAWQTYFPQAPEGRWQWMYEANPAGRGLVWIARHQESGAMVGSTALLPRRFVVRGRPCTAGIAADFVVHDGHRAFGPAVALQRATATALEDGELDFMYGLPNPRALAVLKRAGYQRVGSVTHLTRLLRARDFIAKRTRSDRFANFLAPLADLALGLVAASRARARSSLDVSPMEPQTFDARFDDLWRTAQENHPILGERSGALLNWRFKKHPVARHHVFGLYDRCTEALLGYVVFHTVHRRTTIDDLLCRDLGMGLDRLIMEFAASQRRQGTQAIAAMFAGDPRLIHGLRRNGFVVRDVGDPIVVQVGRDSPIAETLMCEDNWWLFPVDNDV